MSPVRVRLIRSLTVIALAVPLVAVPVVAQAKDVTHADARGDAVHYVSRSAPPTPALGLVNGDIVGTMLRHTDRRVQMRFRFADLRRVVVMYNELYSRVVTNEGVRRDVILFAHNGNWAGSAYMSQPNAGHVRCPVRHSIDYLNNVITVGFPRTCLSQPRWVRIAASYASDPGDDTYFGDDALTDGFDPDATAPRFSSRVYRG